MTLFLGDTACAVVSTVITNQEGCGFDPRGLSVWCLASSPCGFSLGSLLPQSKEMHVMQIGDCRLPAGVSVNANACWSCDKMPTPPHKTSFRTKDTWEAPATPATLNAGEVLIEHRWIDRGLCCLGMTRKFKGPHGSQNSLNQSIHSFIQCIQTVSNTPFTSFTAPLFSTCAITYSSGNSARCDVTKGDETKLGNAL